MGHKTITISDDAYNALAKARNEDESFTKVILRLTSHRTSASSLLQYIRDFPADEELAAKIEEAARRTGRAHMRRADL